MAKSGEYGVKKLRKIQFGIETDQGTAVLPTTNSIWRGTGKMEDQRVVTRPTEDIGYLAQTSRAYIPMKGSLLTLDAVASFEQIQMLFETGIKTVTAVKDGSGSGYLATYPFAMTGAQIVKTRTVESGDNQEMDTGTFFFTREFTLSGSQKQALMMNAIMEGRTSEPLVYSASLAYVSSGKHITDAAEGLISFLTGMSVRTSGTAKNNGVYTVATGGVDHEIITSEALEDENAIATVLEQYFTAAATLPTVSEILFGNFKLYMDPTITPTTQVSNTLLGITAKIKPGQQAVFSGDGGIDHRFLKQVGPEVSLDLMLEWNGSASAERRFAKAATPRYLRLVNEGPVLGTAGTTYHHKTLSIDLYGTWDTFKTLDEQDGDDIVNATFVMNANASAAANQILLVNEVGTASW